MRKLLRAAMRVLRGRPAIRVRVASTHGDVWSTGQGAFICINGVMKPIRNTTTKEQSS